MSEEREIYGENTIYPTSLGEVSGKQLGGGLRLTKAHVPGRVDDD